MKKSHYLLDIHDAREEVAKHLSFNNFKDVLTYIYKQDFDGYDRFWNIDFHNIIEEEGSKNPIRDYMGRFYCYSDGLGILELGKSYKFALHYPRTADAADSQTDIQEQHVIMVEDLPAVRETTEQENYKIDIGYYDVHMQPKEKIVYTDNFAETARIYKHDFNFTARRVRWYKVYCLINGIEDLICEYRVHYCDPLVVFAGGWSFLLRGRILN